MPICVNKFMQFSQVVKLLVLTTLFCGGVIQVGCLNFNYAEFREESGPDFIFIGSSNLYLGALQVTRDLRGASISNLSGRVLYHQHFKLWSKKKNITASFNSTFDINISPQTVPGGEGLAFILAGANTNPDNSAGQWLGIANASTNGSASDQTVAVEFDTKKSYSQDIDDNHVGVDVNSVYSIQQVSLGSLGVNLSSANNVTARIQYDGVAKIMSIFVFMKDGTGGNRSHPVISIPLDLSSHLPEDVYVGFSASTGEDTQLNCVTSWSFSAHIDDDTADLLWVCITVPTVVIILLSGSAFYIYRKRKRNKQQVQYKDPEIELEIQGSATAPQRFQLKELQSATGNFNPKNRLGEGGFGTVYKGLLNDKEVAVKKVKDSGQGKQEFISEVSTIGGLNHKNLVKLIGWCHERNEFLLVYEYMPNGSLDKLIFGNEMPTNDESTLSWERRLTIVSGVAQALDYLHNGCEKRVLHRDIKASNIMLDSEFNARLGDFGLARMIQLREKTHHSTREIAGTPGYMAPESFHMNRATVETDVYAFGVLVLEVVCGRKPGYQHEENDFSNGIVDWVWELYRRGRITDVVDIRLNGDFEEEQAERVLMLGLACSHPSLHQRPSMRSALQVLAGEADPPPVPIEKPAFMWPPKPPSFSNEMDCSLGGHQKIAPFTEVTGR